MQTDRAMRRLDRMVTGKAAWTADTLAETDFILPLPAECGRELQAAAAALGRNRLPTVMLSPDHYDLTASRRFIGEVRRVLDEGCGFAVIDRLPVENIEPFQAIGLYWLLSSLLSVPVAQKMDGTVIYDVEDLGAPAGGDRPRASPKTNAEQQFHSDNAFNDAAPDFVGLLCLQPAPEGGVSGTIAFPTVHNELMRRCPELLPRFYEPFCFDRGEDRWPEESRVYRAPVFTYDGELRGRFGQAPILNGYKAAAEPLDARGEAGLAALREIFADRSLSCSFGMARGQIQYLKNRRVCHRRTGFTDRPDEGRRRHLVRLWMRDGGARWYRG